MVGTFHPGGHDSGRRHWGICGKLSSHALSAYHPHAILQENGVHVAFGGAQWNGVSIRKST